MKSILLTSTALVAFAGAAAADGHTSVSLSGEASAEYNSELGFDMSTEITATGSAALDNGLTATASLTFEATQDNDGTFSSGSISLESDTAGLTFGYGLNGAIYSVLEDDYLVQLLGGADETLEEQVDGVTAYAEFGAATLYVSAPIAVTSSTDALEFGISADVAGWTVGVAGTGASDAAVKVTGTVAGATITLGGSTEDEYDFGVDYTVGPVTLGFSTDEGEEYTITGDYAANGFSAGFEYVTDETWEVSAGYDMNGLALEASYNSAEVVVVDGTYDLGNGLTVGAGATDNVETVIYAFGELDLGGGATAFLDWTDSAADLSEVGPSERDILVGTTVGVSFTF